jgi:hypothetical protein
LQIQEIAHSFRGTRFHKTADLQSAQQYSIDHSGGRKNSIYTSVDCYVSGTYTDKEGKTLEVIQRYTVYVAYNRDTQMTAMNETRQRIMQDFERNFPWARVSDVFIPEAKFIKPLGDGAMVQDEGFYYGSSLFRDMSRIDVARYKMSTERDIYKTNIKGIKRRYGL